MIEKEWHEMYGPYLKFSMEVTLESQAGCQTKWQHCLIKMHFYSVIKLYNKDALLQCYQTVQKRCTFSVIKLYNKDALYSVIAINLEM